MFLYKEYYTSFQYHLPSNFSSPLGLFGDLRQFSVVVLVVEEFRCFRRLQPVQGSLSCCPLCLPLSFSIILLCCEGSLHENNQSNPIENILGRWMTTYSKQKISIIYLIFKYSIPCLPTQCISNHELENIQRYVGDNGVEPDNTCPSPSHTFDSCKFPVCINSKNCSKLNRQTWKQY